MDESNVSEMESFQFLYAAKRLVPPPRSSIGGGGADWIGGKGAHQRVLLWAAERNGTLRSCAPLLTPATLQGDLLSLIWWALWNEEGDEGGGGRGGDEPRTAQRPGPPLQK